MIMVTSGTQHNKLLKLIILWELSTAENCIVCQNICYCYPHANFKEMMLRMINVKDFHICGVKFDIHALRNLNLLFFFLERKIAL